ncbi:HdeD family acid-resistance protein [Novosphingobium sp. 9]|uniref:HdeD family acid-resistance protein n=1 Tax=Novosphingobium sp. 9 TaxID=2025349 RepID=UPI0021B6C8D9|nr:DUF308 domain-containing protein [Novosphingobium sp. 9]
MVQMHMDPTLDPSLNADPLVSAAAREPSGWAWVLAYGIVLLLIALAVLVEPAIAGVAAGLVIGLVLTLYGIAAIASGFTAMSSRARWIEIGLGVVALIAGLVSLFNPLAGAVSLVWAIGVWLLVTGVLQLAAGFKARHDRGWRIGMGVLDVLLGLILMFAGPLVSLAFLAGIVAITLGVRGVFLLVVARDMRKGLPL